jgi:HrpA-like RNA helicase
MKWPTENKWLQDLPVSKSLAEGEIDLQENFCMVAATGSGKTMVIAPAIVLQTGRKVILRQPTRQIAWLVYRSLKEFWGEHLKIGIRTSEQKVGTIAENDITVVTDGVMRNALKDYDADITVIFDEAHWMHEPTEIELGIVKTFMNQNKDIRCVLLSATIRPENFLNYFEPMPHAHARSIKDICDALEQGSSVNELTQPQFMKCYYAEGVMFPVKRFITHAQNDISISQFCARMKDESRRGLVFLTTRNEVKDYADKMQQKIDMPMDFCHADRNVDEIKNFVDDNEPCVLFATVSMATSATLPFDEVLIIDRGLESDWVDEMPILRTNQPIDDNGIIQRAGRVGRTKPGVVYLNTMHKKKTSGYTFGAKDWLRQTWHDISPTEIKPPLESLPLDMVVLTCASYELNIRRLDLLSNLSAKELQEISERMVKRGIIENDHGELSLTKLGKRINSMQMGVWPAYSLCMARDDMIPLVLASQAGPGMFGLFDDEAASKRWRARSKPFKSMAGFRADIVAAASGLSKTELNDWCDENGLNRKKIGSVLYAFKEMSKKALKENGAGMLNRLSVMNINEMEESLIKHNSMFRMQKDYSMDYDYRWGYNGNVAGFWAMCSKDEVNMLAIPLGSGIKIKASPKKITTKKGKEMIILEDITLVDTYD